MFPLSDTIAIPKFDKFIIEFNSSAFIVSSLYLVFIPEYKLIISSVYLISLSVISLSSSLSFAII